MRQLLRLLVTTMAANPLQMVRNAAYYALDAVLSACSVRASPCAPLMQGFTCYAWPLRVLLALISACSVRARRPSCACVMCHGSPLEGVFLALYQGGCCGRAACR